MAERTTPYGAFNFLVNLNGPQGPETPLGGFSDVNGLGVEIVMAEYRNGNDKENHVRKVAGLHKVSDVTLKRGIVNSQDLWDWIKDAQRNGPTAQRTVTITLRDEAGESVESWILRNVIPRKYSGPALSAKGGGEVAMEELVLCAEGLEIEAA